MIIANKVHEYQLKNGFRLLVKEDHRSPIAIFQIFYKVGSSYEYNGLTGISHVLEHMMFRGTHNYSADKFLQKISELGGQQNAHTGHDLTAYYEILTANKLGDCFNFEADRMQNLSLREKDFSKEIQIVMEERRLVIEDDPHQQTYEHFAAAAYVSSPYHHPIIGWMNDLQNMTVSDLKNWYKMWYAPNNAIGVVVGDIVPQKVHQMAKKYFGPLKSSVIPNLKPQKEINPKGPRTIVVKTPAKLPWLVIGYNTPVVGTAEEKWEPYALLVLCELLAGGNSARLQKNLVRGKQIAIDIDYRYSPFHRLSTVLAFTGTPTPNQNIQELRDAIFDEFEKLKEQSPSAKEIERVKVQILASRVYEDDSIVNQANEIGNFEAIGLSWKEINNAYNTIETITTKQVQMVARKYLIQDHLTLANLEPLPLSEKKFIVSKHPIKHHKIK